MPRSIDGPNRARPALAATRCAPALAWLAIAAASGALPACGDDSPAVSAITGDAAAMGSDDAGVAADGDAAAVTAPDAEPASDGATDGPAPDAGAPPACPALGPPVCPDPPLRYADVQPIFERRCVTCHFEGGGEGSPWPLTQYEYVSDWSDTIKPDLIMCTMPPPDSDAGLTADERMTLLLWIVCGLAP